MQELLAKILPAVFRFAVHLSGDPHFAEDLAQEAVVRAVRSFQMPADASEEQTTAALRVWLLKAVRNHWIDHCRRQNMTRIDIIEMDDLYRKEFATPEFVLEQKELLHRVKTAMDALPEMQRLTMQLISCEGLTVAETAKILEITPEAVRSSVSVARSKLRKIFDNSTFELQPRGRSHDG